VKDWRSTEGPAREVFFPQVHKPGKLSQSDFTHMGALGVTIGGTPFDHLIYHFVLTYSNWECGSICFSESFESLSEGLQQALWKLAGTPAYHQTDNLSAAVNKPANPETFTSGYQSLLSHYKLAGRRIQPRHPNEFEFMQSTWKSGKAKAMSKPFPDSSVQASIKFNTGTS